MTSPTRPRVDPIGCRTKTGRLGGNLGIGRTGTGGGRINKGVVREILVICGLFRERENLSSR